MITLSRPVDLGRLNVRLGTLVALSLGLASSSAAQSDRSGRIEGTVTDSAHARPFAGVRVVAVRADAPTEMPGATTAGEAGGFRIDSLAPGLYIVGFESPLLDSLEIALPPRKVAVAPGGAATVALALPSAAKLRAAVCPKVTPPRETGAVYGHVVSAETENPVRGAAIAVAWQKRIIDRKTLRPIDQERTAWSTTDAAGWYVVCGVPTGTWLSMQLQHSGRVGPVFRMLIDDTLGIAKRHLSFSISGTWPVVITTARSAEERGVELLSGTATLNGTVLGPGDVPLSAAEVRVLGTHGSARTDAVGRFSLAGLPAGTQLLEVRHVGYLAAETPVELRSNATTMWDVRMRRVVNLDSIRVVATRVRYDEFEEHRRQSLSGRFLGPDEVARQRVTYTSDIVQRTPGFDIVGEGMSATVVSTRGGRASGGPCRPNIVIDGTERRDINEVHPMDIAAMELYREGEMAPTMYDRGCGAVVIWTRRGRRR